MKRRALVAAPVVLAVAWAGSENRATYADAKPVPPGQAKKTPTAPTATPYSSATATRTLTSTSTPVPTKTPAPTATATVAGAFPYEALPGERTQLLELINRSRAEAGVPSLQWHSRLAEIAQWRVEDMQARHYSTHQIPAGACFEGRCWNTPIYFWDVATAIGLYWAAAGENLWQGSDYRDQLAEISHEVFLGSPSHRAGLLNSDFTHGATGMGLYTWTNGTHTVELFIRPQGVTAAAQTTSVEVAGGSSFSSIKARKR